jgi:hypothetical protein
VRRERLELPVDFHRGRHRCGDIARRIGRIGDGNVNCHWGLGEVFCMREGCYRDEEIPSIWNEMRWKLLSCASQSASTLPLLRMFGTSFVCSTQAKAKVSEGSYEVSAGKVYMRIMIA